MDDIEWISPQEHDNTSFFINVLTTGGVLWNWGQESGSDLGRGTQADYNKKTAVDPGAPTSFATGSNADIIKVESGGHTTMILRKCEKNFGYVGHRISGSMGNGSGAEAPENSFNFTTAPMQIAGAITTPTIRNDVSGTFCSGATISLVGQPAGGSFAVVSGSATVSGNQLTFTGTGAVQVSYTVTGMCTPDVVTFTAGTCKSISGNIWQDDNGNAVKDGAEAGTSNGGSVWVNLVDPSGNVVQSVPVDTYGNYTLSVTGPVAGDYKIIVTNSKKTAGDPLPTAETPLNNHKFSGTNIDGTASGTNRTGAIILTDFQNSTVSKVDFGITDQPLSVNFGAINAKFINGQLVVDFTTLKESNNSLFEIEASTDGVNFSKIGEVVSQAKDGNSSSEINYSFSKDASAATAVLGFGLLAIGGLGFGFKRNRKIIFGLMMLIGMATAYTGCAKNDAAGTNDGNLFVRIVQVDKDGGKSYSKTVVVTKQ